MANATTRAKRLNETKMILRQPLLLIAIILSFALLLLFVIYPLAKTLIYSLTDETGAVSLATLITTLQTPRYGKVFGRTMALGLIVAVIATFIGYVFAYTVTRVNVPAKGFFKTMATLPILSPPFVLSLSIIFLFGKQGLISKNLLGITGSSVYGLKSLIVVQVMSFFPIAYLTLSGILAATMSTADSQLLAAASSVSQDLMQHSFGIKMNQRTTMLAARATVICIAIIGMVLAWDPNSSVFRVVSFAWAGFGAAFGPVMLFSLFWKRANKQGALAGMITGGAVVFIWKYLIAPMGGAWAIYELLPAFLAACIAIVIVSLATPAPEKAVTDTFDEICGK